MEKCRWYDCGVGSKPCAVMRNANRLFCRECSLTRGAAGPPPEEPETNLNLGAWPAEVNMGNKIDIAEAAPPETVGAAIIQVRRAKGLSQTALADLCGIAVASLNKWEKGKIIPRLSSLQLLDEYLGSDLARRFGSASKAGAKTEEASAFSPKIEADKETVGESAKVGKNSDPATDVVQSRMDIVLSEALAKVFVEIANGFFEAAWALNRKNKELRR